ncbi:MAG: thiamine phosphate synthase [Vicinamibacterales bacterium]
MTQRNSVGRLYAIVDIDACERVRRTPMEVTRAFLAAGVGWLQLRAKRWESGVFLDLAQEMTAEARRARAKLIVNDRADIAAIADADGVHIGQNDLPPVAVRHLVGASSIVGLSTHSDSQLVVAVDQPISYLAIGPIFGTGTKDTGYEAIGLDAVRRAAGIAKRASLPLVAIGGITLEHAPAVIESGADSVAVISDLLVGDPESRARAFVRALQ